MMTDPSIIPSNKNQENPNPLDELGIRREHIIAIKEAYTNTNKRSSTVRARYLLELVRIFETFDRQRIGLHWDLDDEEI